MSRGQKKRSGGTPPEITAQPVPSKPPWYKRAWVVASAVGGIAFTLGMNGPTLLQNIRKLPSEVNATSEQYLSWIKEDEEWTGNWSTFPEGIVNMEDMKLSTGVDLRISLHSKNGEISGEISSGAICKGFPAFDFLLVRGNVSGNSAHLTVWEIIGGETKTFEEIELNRQEGVITVIPKAGASSWFTNRARLGKHPETDKDFLQNFCNRAAQPASAPS